MREVRFAIHHSPLAFVFLQKRRKEAERRQTLIRILRILRCGSRLLERAHLTAFHHGSHLRELFHPKGSASGQASWDLVCTGVKVYPPFDHFYFIDMNPDKTAYLMALCKGRHDVDIVTDDASLYLTRKLLPTIQFEKFNRALCLLDPYGLHLDWEVMRQAGQSTSGRHVLKFPRHGYEPECDLEKSGASAAERC